MKTQPAMVCMGDLHLSHWIWYGHKDIRDDALVTFTELVSTAISLGVPLVLVGDLNDTVTPPTDIVEFIRGQVDRCVEAQIPIFFIDGNHDKRPLPWLTAISDWPVHIGHGEMVEINGIKCVGFDYALSVDIQANLAELSTRPELPQVLFLHQAVKQGLGFEGASNCDLDWVPFGIPLTIMGDLHAPTEHKTAGGTALYTGSTHPRNIGEIGEKSMVIVNEDLTWHRKVYQTQRQFRRETLVEGTPTDLQPYLDWAKLASNTESTLAPVLWLEYSLDRVHFVEDLAKELKEQYPQVIVVLRAMKFRTHASIEQDVDTSDAPTIPQLVERVVSPKDHPFAYELVRSLTDPKADPSEVIAAYRARFLATIT